MCTGNFSLSFQVTMDRSTSSNNITTTKKKPLEPLITYRALKKILNGLTYVMVGNYHYDPNLKWNRHFTMSLCFAVTICVFQTVGMYNNRNNLLHFLYIACILPFGVMGIARLFLSHSYHRKFFKLSTNLEMFIETREHDKQMFPILLWYSRGIKMIVYVTIVFFIIGGVLIIVSPVIIYTISGEMDMILQILIPGVDHHSHPGFEIHLVVVTFAVFTSIGGFSAFIYVMIMILAYSCGRVDILIEKENHVSELIQTNDKHEKETEVYEHLREIYKLHQELLMLIDGFEDLWSLQQLSDHLLFGCQIVITLYICTQEIYLTGYFIIVSGIFVIFMLDLLGTIIEVKLDKLSAETYNIPWYLLSEKHKRDFIYFLANTQKTVRLTLRNSIPLNLDTFVRFCKGIYSYLMVLREIS